MRRGDSLENTLMLGGIGAGGEGDDRGSDGWMASLTRWSWVWMNSGSLWWTGRPGVLRFMGSQRVGHDRVTELNWTELNLPQNTSLTNETKGMYSILYHRNKNVLFLQKPPPKNKHTNNRWHLPRYWIWSLFHMNFIGLESYLDELSKINPVFVFRFASSTSLSIVKSLTENSDIAQNYISITLHIIRSRKFFSSENLFF